jgi:hypothetical protein
VFCIVRSILYFKLHVIFVLVLVQSTNIYIYIYIYIYIFVMLILLLLLELFKGVNLNKYIMSERKQRKLWARGYKS